MIIKVYLFGLSQDQAKKVAGAIERINGEQFVITDDYNEANLVICHLYMMLVTDIYSVDKMYGVIINLPKSAILEHPENSFLISRIDADFVDHNSIVGLVEWVMARAEKYENYHAFAA